MFEQDNNGWVRFTDENGVALTLVEVEEQIIAQILKMYRPTEAARVLGIGRSTLYRKVEEYGLENCLRKQKRNLKMQSKRKKSGVTKKSALDLHSRSERQQALITRLREERLMHEAEGTLHICITARS